VATDEARMTFTEHLGELRTRIIRSGIAVAVACLLCYILSNAIFDLVARPLLPRESTEIAPPWVALNPLEGVFVKLKLAGVAGIILALPYVSYQLAAFVFPGLTAREKKTVSILTAGCGVLAIAGVSLAYFGILPTVLPYLMDWNPEGVQSQLRLSETVSLLLKFYAGFAVAFQFPLVVLVLVFLDVVSPAALKSYRKIVFVGIAMLSALLTPPDVLTMVMMATPLVLLYELSIWASYVVARIRHKRDREE